MQKLSALRQALSEAQLWDEPQFESWVEGIRITPRGKIESGGGQQRSMLAADLLYSAVLSIERYHYPAHPIEQLITLLAVWLMDNDHDRRDLPDVDPQIEVAVLDDNTADIEITVWFREHIHMRENPDGDINAWGSQWQREQPLLLTAERLERFDAQ